MPVAVAELVVIFLALAVPAVAVVEVKPAMEEMALQIPVAAVVVLPGMTPIRVAMVALVWLS